MALKLVLSSSEAFCPIQGRYTFTAVLISDFSIFRIGFAKHGFRGCEADGPGFRIPCSVALTPSG